MTNNGRNTTQKRNASSNGTVSRTTRNKPAPAIGPNLPLGGMSIATAAEVPRLVVTTRKVLSRDYLRKNSTASTLPSQSPYGISTHYCAVREQDSLKDYFDSTDPMLKVYKQFRIKKVEYFIWVERDVAANEYDGPVDIYTSVDYSSEVINSWYDFNTRNNIGNAVIRANNPKQLVARYGPRPMFTDSTTSNTPSNMMLGQDQWFDIDAVSQQFGGVHIWAYAPTETNFTIYVSKRAHIQFRHRI